MYERPLLKIASKLFFGSIDKLKSNLSVYSLEISSHFSIFVLEKQHHRNDDPTLKNSCCKK
jgi:hypothetical protein